MNIECGTGRIFQINSSLGGVPKQARALAEVSLLGILSDDHNDKRDHGGPDRAICLYSLEHIVALQSEGHPIFPGSIGENVTTIGVDLSTLHPGMRLQLGEEVTLEITSYTVPCKTIRESFIEHKFTRISQSHYPGWSRLYARVLTGGRISVGDAITVGDMITRSTEQSGG
jgi:MOSC domain-containing protein YiiM